MTTKTTQKMLLIPGDAVMNGFCYDYCQALLLELKRLVKNDKPEKFPDLTECVTMHLRDQLGTSVSADINGIILCERFLAIFEKKA